MPLVYDLETLMGVIWNFNLCEQLVKDWKLQNTPIIKETSWNIHWLLSAKFSLVGFWLKFRVRNKKELYL